MAKSKARLVADKISKYERKGKAEVHMVYQGYEESEFWHYLGGMPEKVRPNELLPYRGDLYKVSLFLKRLKLWTKVYKSVIKRSKITPIVQNLPRSGLFRVTPTQLSYLG